MSRALVIKGANFETNRVAHVDFSGVPCTAVAFDSASYTVGSMSTPTVPVITKTPADTTDELVLTVSDTSVAKVVEGGLYAVGFGTTTVTATCGSATATATITVSSIEFVPVKLSESRINSVSSWGNDNPIQYSVNSGYDSFAAEKTTSVSTPDGILSNSNISVIKIPSGTNKIKLQTTVTNWSIRVRYTSTDSTLHTDQTYFAKFISSATKNVARTSDNYVEFTDMPSDADSFALDFNHHSDDYNFKAIFTPAS